MTYNILQILSLNDGQDVCLHLPTVVILTVALSPMPSVLIGTQVYTPSAITVVLNTPELQLPMRLSFK